MAMADESNQTPTPQPVPLVYANVMAASAGAIDLSLDFGYRGPAAEVEVAVRVVMAWEHAALMHEIIGQLLERYQEDVGEIRDVKKVATIRPIEIGPQKEEGRE